MTKYEKLLQKAHENGAKVYEIDLGTDLPCGKCVNNFIFINSRISDKEKYCILSEELGHYHKTVGDITNQSTIPNIKQELIARKWGYERLVGIVDLINAHKSGVKNKFELAEYLHITEDFLESAIEYYRGKYGITYQIDNYIIYFHPNFGVLEII